MRPQLCRSNENRLALVDMAVFMGAAFSPLGGVLCMLTSLILYLVYRLLYAPYHVHKQYGIKGPRPNPFWGSYSEIKKMKMNSFLEEGQKKYGSVFGFYIGSKFNVVVCDLELVERILVDHHDKLHCGGPYTMWSQLILDSLRVPLGLQTASGQQWRSSRTALAPAFSPLKIREIIPVVNQGCTTLVQNIAGIAKSQKSVDIHQLYVKYTMETITATAFGQDTQTAEQGSGLITATNEFITAFLDRKNFGLEELTVTISHFPLLRPLLVQLSAHMTASEAHMRLREAGCRLVEARHSHTSPPQDLLQLLMDTKLVKEDGSQERLSDPQIVSHAVDFLLAGYETTASVLSCTSHLLAIHTKIQDKVQEDIDKFFKKRPDKSLYDASLRLPYLDSVIQEAMRIYPPTPILFRYCEADIELERYTVPKGADVCIPVFLLHRNPEQWPQPHRFNPDRFSEEKRLKRHDMAHIPFGAGPHNCIGMKFALAEIKMALIAILRHYTFVRSSNTEVPLEITHGMVDTPKNGVFLHILPRQSL